MSKNSNAGDGGADLGDKKSRAVWRSESSESKIPLPYGAPARVLLEDMLSVARSVG